MHISVIGCGSIGQRHATNIKALGHSLLLFDRDTALATATAHRLDCSMVGGLRSLSNGGAFISSSDAVLICTPASTHADVARELLAAGYRGPLFVEKPLALSVEECAVFQAWPHQTTMVGYNLRFHEVVVEMRKRVPQASRGGFLVECDMSAWPGASYGSPMLELSHEIDLALHCGATPKIASVEVDEGATEINFTGSWCVQLDGASKRYVRSWDIGGGGIGFMWRFNSPEELGTEMYMAEIARFLDCAEGGVPTETPFADGILVLDVIEQAKAMLGQHA